MKLVDEINNKNSYDQKRIRELIVALKTPINEWINEEADLFNNDAISDF